MDRLEIEAELRGLIEEVHVGHENLLAGQDFGMRGINQRIDQTCQAALKLSNEDVLLLQPQMTELRDRLAEFSTHLNMIMERLNEDEDGGTASEDGQEAGDDAPPEAARGDGGE